MECCYLAYVGQAWKHISKRVVARKSDRREGLRVDKWGKRIALDGGNQCENTSEGGSVCERETLSLCGSSVADLCLFNFNLVT